MMVAVAYGRNHLLKAESGLNFRKFASLDNVVEQLASTYQFHNEKDVCLSFDNLIELDDVWVAETTQIIDLSSNLLIHVLFLGQLFLVDDLDSHGHTGSQVISLFRDEIQAQGSVKARNTVNSSTLDRASNLKRDSCLVLGKFSSPVLEQHRRRPDLNVSF
jgi:hypothetical protein